MFIQSFIQLKEKLNYKSYFDNILSTKKTINLTKTIPKFSVCEIINTYIFGKL